MKARFALIALFLAVFGLTSAQIWIKPSPSTQQWIAAHAGIGATLTEVKAIPADAKQSHYISLILNQSTTATANQWSIQSGTGTNCGTTTTAVLPNNGVSTLYVGATNAASVQIIPLQTPIKITAGHAICVLGIATQLTKINIIGYTD